MRLAGPPHWLFHRIGIRTISLRESLSLSLSLGRRAGGRRESKESEYKATHENYRPLSKHLVLLLVWSTVTHGKRATNISHGYREIDVEPGVSLPEDNGGGEDVVELGN